MPKHVLQFSCHGVQTQIRFVNFDVIQIITSLCPMAVSLKCQSNSAINVERNVHEIALLTFY
jgi:hypothetical protein